MLRTAAGQLGGQCQLRVTPRHIHVCGALAAHVEAQLNLSTRVLAQRLLDQTTLGDVVLQHDLAGRCLFCVILRYECSQYVRCILFAIGFRKERARPQISTITECQQQDTGHRALLRHCQHIQISAATIHKLAYLQLANASNQIAQTCGLLELQLLTRRLHGHFQLAGQRIAAAFQKQCRTTDRFGIVVGLDQIHTGRAAAPNLILQARPAAIIEHAVFATAQAKQFLHHVQGVAHGTGAWIRAKVTPRHRSRAAMQTYPWRGVLGQQNIRVAFVIPQQHVVAWLE